MADFAKDNRFSTATWRNARPFLAEKSPIEKRKRFLHSVRNGDKLIYLCRKLTGYDFSKNSKANI